MSAWTDTVSRKRLFGYMLIFAGAGWILDVTTSLVNYTVFGIQVELNPLIRYSLLTHALPTILVYMVLFPSLLIGLGFSIWRAEDPRDSALRINAALVGLIVIGMIHSTVGVLNLLGLLLGAG